MRNKDILKAHLALLGANLFYGAGFSVAKSIMPAYIQPNGFILLRVVGASILFWISYFFGKNFRVTIHKKDWKLFFLCALFGVALNQLLFFQGLSNTTPIHASLMMLSTPILVSIMSGFILKDKLYSWNYLGLALGIIGAAILILLKENKTIASNIIQGDLFVFVNAVSYATYLILVKPLMAKYRPIIVIRWIFLIGTFMVIPFGWSDVNNIPWHNLQSNHYIAILFIVIGVTFFTYLWNIYALRYLSATITGAYIYLQPLFAALISILFLGEHLTITKTIAAILIFIGVFLASKKKQ